MKQRTTVCNPLLLIKQKRKSKGITQEQLTEKAGFDRKTISRIENGDHGIRMRTINAVLIALGIELCAKSEKYDRSLYYGKF